MIFVEADGAVRRTRIDSKDYFDNGKDQHSTAAAAVAVTTTTTPESSGESKVSHRKRDPDTDLDPFYCPSPRFENYDDSFLTTVGSSPLMGLPINNSTSESHILAMAGQIFNGQFSTLIVTTDEHSTSDDKLQQRGKFESWKNSSVCSPLQVFERSRSTSGRTERYISSKIPIQVSPSVTIVHETEFEADDDNDDIQDRTNKLSEKKKRSAMPESRNSNRITVKEVTNDSDRKWKKERMLEDRHVLQEQVVCTVWTSTPRKRRNRLERGQVTKKKNGRWKDGDKHTKSETHSFWCDTKHTHDLEMRCPWHQWQLDYVSLVYKSHLLPKDSTIPQDWFSLHQPLKETGNKDDERVKRRKRGYMENKENEERISTLNGTIKKNDEILVDYKKERNFGRRENRDGGGTLRSDFFQTETWIKSSDFTGNWSRNDKRKKITVAPCSGDDVIILNYLKIKNFHPILKTYTKFFDRPKNGGSTRKTNNTILTKNTSWFHFFRLCYSSLPHLSSLDYDYRLEWSDTDRVDHYRLAHPIFIPETLKWIPILTHPDGATVFGLQEIK